MTSIEIRQQLPSTSGSHLFYISQQITDFFWLLRELTAQIAEANELKRKEIDGNERAKG